MLPQNWRKFEELIAQLHREISPGAKVQHNQRVLGRSGRRRQLDVTITQSVGPYRTFIVIECKRYRRPVQIEKVEAFASKLRDVSASDGVMVSDSGFDAGARASAKEWNITLLTYAEATELDWRQVTKSESWMTIVISKPDIQKTIVKYDSRNAREFSLETLLVDKDGQLVQSLGEFQRSIVASGELPQIFGSFTITYSPVEALFLRAEEDIVSLTELELHVMMRFYKYVMNVVLAYGHVLRDSNENDVVLQQMISEPWDMHKLIRLPGEEISAEEAQRLSTPGDGRLVFLKAPLHQLKRYMRVVIAKP